MKKRIEDAYEYQIEILKYEERTVEGIRGKIKLEKLELKDIFNYTYIELTRIVKEDIYYLFCDGVVKTFDDFEDVYNEIDLIITLGEKYSRKFL